MTARTAAEVWTGGGFTWSTFADDVIRQIYPTGGSAGCMKILTTRTQDAITSRASELKVKRIGPTGGVPPTRDFAGIPVQDDAADHRVWMEVDRLIHGQAVGVLAPRLGV